MPVRDKRENGVRILNFADVIDGLSHLKGGSSKENANNRQSLVGDLRIFSALFTNECSCYAVVIISLIARRLAT